ncbi:MAG: tryptophan synthase subunit alpha [Acidobacteriota bacterium]|jgi:tryptophan synthase alpha chain|nr:tryptophan synthase subunit alpha [Acidobacteriota bacterium]
MNRIKKAFENKKAFIAFITGGDPDIETTEKLVIALTEAGADIIEIGIPFSDPIAEGAVIQEASERSLANGCTVDKLFEMVKRVREKVDTPLLFMTYINPVFVYGKEQFMKKCADCGIDGIIVPDLPFEESDELSYICEQHGITQISMIAPTSEERIKMIAENAGGFLYCVSSLGVTGVRSEINTGVSEMIQKVKAVSSVPCAVGFGISTPEQARDMAAVSDGVIIGSAIVRLAAEYGRDCEGPVKKYAREIKYAMENKNLCRK